MRIDSGDGKESHDELRIEKHSDKAEHIEAIEQ